MVEIEATYLPLRIWKTTIERAGFQDVIWHTPKVSPERILLVGETYWDDLVHPPVRVYIEATK